MLQVLQEELVRDSKGFKQLKNQNIKKNLDQIVIVQRDLQNCVQVGLHHLDWDLGTFCK